jgi:predicted transcriptional regulator
MSNSKLGTRDWKAQRRLQALTLKRKGWKQKAIAAALGVTKGAVSHWLTGADKQGEAALQARPIADDHLNLL